MAAPASGAFKEVRCPFCKALFFEARGGGGGVEVRVKCKCKRLVTIRPGDNEEPRGAARPAA